MQDSDFLVGLLCGFVMAGIIGYLLAQINLERTKAGSENRPMSVQSSKTPADVRKSSREAATRMLGLVLLLMVVVAMGVSVIYLVVSIEGG